MKWLVADWGDSKAHIFKDVLAALGQMGHRTTCIARLGIERRGELVAAIRGGGYDAVLTWQRFYPMQKEILSALAESRIPTVYMDFGFVPHYGSVVFDTAGENAASSWPAIWSSGSEPAILARHLDEAEVVMRTQASLARFMPAPALRQLAGLRLPFVFVPLQRPKDSVVKHDSKVHDFGALLRRVLYLSRGRFFVVCKTHPLDKGMDLGVPDRVTGSHVILRESFGEANESLCDYLLAKAALVVGVNSNMLFRALAFGTPAIATGRGWYSGSGALHEVNGLDGLHSLDVPPPDPVAQRRYIGMCLSRQLPFSELSNPEKLAEMLDRIGIMSCANGACR